VSVVAQRLLHQELTSLDVDNDGTLTVEEFMASDYARGMREAALQRFLQRYDPNGTGVLDLSGRDELVNMTTHVAAGHMFGMTGVFPDLSPVRLDQAVASGRAGARVLFLSQDRFGLLERMYPGLCDKIRRLCELEMSPHLGSSAPDEGEGDPLGTLDFKVARTLVAIKDEMRRKLGAAKGGSNCGRPADVLVNTAPEGLYWHWQAGCCVAKSGGELLFFPYSAEGFRATEPTLLGHIQPGTDTARRSQSRSIRSRCFPRLPPPPRPLIVHAHSLSVLR
jgi:hypothetical protein